MGHELLRFRRCVVCGEGAGDLGAELVTDVLEARSGEHPLAALELGTDEERAAGEHGAVEVLKGVDVDEEDAVACDSERRGASGFGGDR